MFRSSALIFALLVFLAAASAQAATFTGTLYYTVFSGPPNNVDKVNYSYNDVTHSFSLSGNAAVASVNGADGIIFGPDGFLLVGGQNTGQVYRVNPATGASTSVATGDSQSFHLTLDPSGNLFYSSPFGGRLDTIPLPFGTNGTPHTITGGDPGVTQIAFADNGQVFYVDGNPNGNGNVGTINLSTFVTTRFGTNIQSAHGMIFDPYTNKITMFGAGKTGTIDPTTHAIAQSPIQFIGDFDQGAVDGLGHAFIAGSNSITMLDYSISHDITHPDFFTSIGGFTNIDDMAPLVGAGSQQGAVPEPASLTIFGVGLVGLLGCTWRPNRRRVSEVG